MPTILSPLAGTGAGTGARPGARSAARPGARSAARRAIVPALACATLTLFGLPRLARAQDSTRAKGVWVGVGAIGHTAMFMNTTSIERDGRIRRVWLESVNPEPTAFVVGSDTTRFDTVLALHVIDCRAWTDAVATARYYLAGVRVAPPRPADTNPTKLRGGTFMAAVAADLCGDRASAPPGGSERGVHSPIAGHGGLRR